MLGDDGHKVCSTQVHRSRVAAGVAAYPAPALEVGVKGNLHISLLVVKYSERRNRTGVDADLLSEIGW